MPTIIIPPFTPPIPRFTPASGQIIGPADGDSLLASSVNDAFIQLADRSTISFAGLYGAYGSRLVASCKDGLNITINPQAAVRSSSGVLSGNLGSPLTIATMLGAAPVASTWYYLYGADMAGVLTPIISTDAPDATLKYRFNNVDQVFLSLFRTDSGAAVRPFIHFQGMYEYLPSINVLTGGAADLLVHPVPLADVPPFTVFAYIALDLLEPSLTGAVNYGYPGFLSRQIRTGGVGSANNMVQQKTERMPINGPTGFEYQKVSFTATLISAELLGFEL